MLATFTSLTSLLLLSTILPSNYLWFTCSCALFILSFFFIFFYLSHAPLFLLSFSFFDLISISLILITLWVAGLIIISSQKSLWINKHPKKFLLTILSLTTVLALAFMLKSMLIFYIFFEASLIPTLLLVLGWGYQPERLQARVYLILYTVTASLPLLIFLILTLKSTGRLTIYPLFPWAPLSSPHFQGLWWLFSILAFLVKTPLFLTHLWLPKAHVEAPVAGSIVLAGVLLKLGSYGLIRLMEKFTSITKICLNPVLTIALIGGVITGFICTRQSDVKALIAYSSVSHIGLATRGILSLSSWGWQGALLILLAHGLCSSCLFSLANMTYETVGSRRIYISRGLISLFPSLAFWWFCFAACNIAAPPSINLTAEILLISSSIFLSNVNFLPLAFIIFLAAAYSLYLYTSTQHGKPSSFSSPLALFAPRLYTICVSHFLPLIFLTLKRDLVSRWL